MKLSVASVESAQSLLRSLGFDDERCNERSALVLLALASLKPGDKWSTSQPALTGVRPMMDWMRESWDKTYAENSRETVRRFTLHQFTEVHLIIENPDEPTRPKNSPNWNYQLTPGAITVIQLQGTSGFETALAEYVRTQPSQLDLYQRAREMDLVPVHLPNGKEVQLSAGGQNPLIKSMVEQFCPRFTPDGNVLYIGDAGAKYLVYEEEALAQLGVSIDAHGKMPDLVVHMANKNWLVLMEAASSHGPVDHTRYIELNELFAESTAGLVFISCFPDKKTMRRYLADIAWETDVWISDNPTHLIHFNGTRFLGPYGS